MLHIIITSLGNGLDVQFTDQSEMCMELESDTVVADQSRYVDKSS